MFFVLLKLLESLLTVGLSSNSGGGRVSGATSRTEPNREQDESNTPILRKRLQVEKGEQEKSNIGEEGEVTGVEVGNTGFRCVYIANLKHVAC